MNISEPRLKHVWHYRLMLAVSHFTRRLFGSMALRIEALPVSEGQRWHFRYLAG